MEQKVKNRPYYKKHPKLILYYLSFYLYQSFLRPFSSYIYRRERRKQHRYRALYWPYDLVTFNIIVFVLGQVFSRCCCCSCCCFVLSLSCIVWLFIDSQILWTDEAKTDGFIRSLVFFQKKDFDGRKCWFWKMKKFFVWKLIFSI